jgi:hypothetical protein
MPTTNMSLNEPSVGQTAGPDWATEVNANFTTIDQHDHTSGKGVQLTPSALNINSDLEFNGNAAIELKRLTFDSSATGSGTNYSVYQSGGNLYWYNGSGQAVQITNGANVKTTGGSIDGMSGTDAAVDYGSGIYKFEFDSTKTPFAGAKMSHADINLYKYDGSSGSNAYVILKYTGSSEGSNNLTFPDETGTMLTTATSFAGAINIDATGGSGSITLDAATSVSIEADTTITLDAEGDINLDSNSGVLTFKDNGTAIGKISNSSSDLVIENEVDAKDIIFKQYDGNEIVRMADDRRLYFYDKGGEYIYSDGSYLYLAAGTSVNFLDGNITSVGDIDCDSVSPVAAGTGLSISFAGNTTSNNILLTDNLADALNIREGSNSYIKFVTTDSSEEIQLNKNTNLDASATLDVSQGSLTTSTAQKQAISATAFASGTKMLFNQTAAPTGWTKITASNDVALRVVSGTVGSGGSVAFETAFASHTPTISKPAITMTNAAFTLTTSEIPGHDHTLRPYNGTGNAFNGGSELLAGNGAGSRVSGVGNTGTQGGGGSGGSHTHANSAVLAATPTSSAINLDVSYVDVIIASKD